MWFVVIMLVSIGTGLILGPLLARAAAEQTAEPEFERRVAGSAGHNRIAAQQVKAPVNRLQNTASLN